MANLGRASALKDSINSQVILTTLFACLGAFTFGFDISWWGAVIGNQYFKEKFGTSALDAKTGNAVYSLTPAQLGAGASLGTVGIAFGSLYAAVAAAKYGRKMTFYMTAVISIIGALIQITSGINGYRYWQLVAGKIVVCFGVGIAFATVPLYLAECSPPAVRGALINTYIIFENIAALMAYGVLMTLVSKRTMEVWCIPIGIQFICPVLTLAMCHMLPESPRWLFEVGRKDEARQVLILLNKGGNGFDIEATMQDYETTFAGVSKSTSSWLALFKGKNLLRTYIAVGVQCVQQGQGLSFVSNYLLIFFQGLGFKNSYEILVIYFGVRTVLTFGGFFIQDYLGRRFLLFWGAIGMCLGMMGLGIIVTIHPVLVGAIGNVAVFTIFFWLFFFALAWSPVPWTVATEVPSDLMRGKTLAFAGSMGQVVGLLIGQVSPFLQSAQYAGMGPKIGFLWCAMSFLAAIWTYFSIPELKGRSLGEIDYMFEHGVPLRKMGAYKVESLPNSVNPEELVEDDVEEKKLDIAHEEAKTASPI